VKQDFSVFRIKNQSVRYTTHTKKTHFTVVYPDFSHMPHGENPWSLQVANLSGHLGKDLYRGAGRFKKVTF